MKVTGISCSHCLILNFVILLFFLGFNHQTSYKSLYDLQDRMDRAERSLESHQRAMESHQRFMDRMKQRQNTDRFMRNMMR